MPRVCPQAASEASTFPGLGHPEYFDPAEPRAWRLIESSFIRSADVEWVVRRQLLYNPEVQVGPRPPLGGAILAAPPRSGAMLSSTVHRPRYARRRSADESDLKGELDFRRTSALYTSP